jgi:nucleoside-diphosphate kinase
MADERTLILLKPDAVQRRLMGRLIQRIEDKGFAIEEMRMVRVTADVADRHYAEHVKKPFYPELRQFIMSGPVLAMVVAGPSAIESIRLMLGPTNGLKAPPGTVRGDFATSVQFNLMHASAATADAEREIPIWFPKK